MPAMKGTEASLSYVQCFLYLVSSSVNVSIVFILHGWVPFGQTLYAIQIPDSEMGAVTFQLNRHY